MEDNKKRLDWVDIAKGITILLVIIGHGVGGVLRGIIFSFHMPLFFILSSLTFKPSTDPDSFLLKTKKAFKHLFIAAVGIYFFRTCITLVKDIPLFFDFSLGDFKNYFANIINIFVFGSGVATTVGQTTIDAIGIPWFLFALFFGRTLFDYLHLSFSKKAFYVSVFLCSLIGVCFGLIQWLPFSFDIALAIQPLFLFGQYLKSFDLEKNKLRNFFLSAFIWGSVLLLSYFALGTYLELACRRYTLYPLCFVGAIAGTMFFSYISLFISKFKKLSFPLKYIGMYSMTMLWVHCFDGYYSFAWQLTSHGSINTIIRVVEDIIIFALIMLIYKFIKNRKTKPKESIS